MDDKRRKLNFWLGNAILVLALLVLLGMGSLWESYGSYAMGLWILLAGVGVYFIMIGKAPSEDE
jgi:hypothetical protein